jgi:hypothetical protein
MIDYAELLPFFTLLSLIDHLNNSWRRVETGSGPPKTDVAPRWPRG